MKMIINKIGGLLLCFLPMVGMAQQRISLEDLLKIAHENNIQYQLNELKTAQAEQKILGAVEVPKTVVFVENDDFQPSNPQGEWKVGIEQEIPWPGQNKARKSYQSQVLATYKLNREVLEAEISREVRKSYYQLWFLQRKKQLLKEVDSIYKSTLQAAELRYKAGEVAGLEKIAAEAKYKEAKARFIQVQQQMLVEQQELKRLTNEEVLFLPLKRPLEKIENQENLASTLHPILKVDQQNIQVATAKIAVEKAANNPEISLKAFSQSYLGIEDPLTGFSVGVAFPLFGRKAMKSRIEALKSEVKWQQQDLQNAKRSLALEREQAQAKMEKARVMLQFYEQSGLKQADAIIAAATLSYRSGAIGYSNLSEFLVQAMGIKENYLKALNDYNQATIDYIYLTTGR